MRYAFLTGMFLIFAAQAQADTTEVWRLDGFVGPKSAGNEVSIRRLQAFWAVAHTGSMTRAAKMLGMSRHGLSQQLAAFEAAIGGRLFDRRAGHLELTDLGRAFQGRAEQVLRSVQELEDVLPSTPGASPRRSLRISGAGSVMCTLLPKAIQRLDIPLDQLDFDLHEGAPGEVLETLHARRANIGLVAAGSLPEAALSFRQMPLRSDPYVLAVPARLRLAHCRRTSDLPTADQTLLNAMLQFVFGTQHCRPNHRPSPHTPPPPARFAARARLRRCQPSQAAPPYQNPVPPQGPAPGSSFQPWPCNGHRTSREWTAPS